MAGSSAHEQDTHLPQARVRSTALQEGRLALEGVHGGGALDDVMHPSKSSSESSRSDTHLPQARVRSATLQVGTLAPEAVHSGGALDNVLNSYKSSSESSRSDTHLPQARVRSAALQVGELAAEGVHGGGVHEVGLPPAGQVVGQHVRVVLQDLPVDQLPHLRSQTLSTALAVIGHQRGCRSFAAQRR